MVENTTVAAGCPASTENKETRYGSSDRNVAGGHGCSGNHNLLCESLERLPDTARRAQKLRAKPGVCVHLAQSRENTKERMSPRLGKNKGLNL